MLEHPPTGDDRGYVLMVSPTGESGRLTPEFTSIKSLAWGTAADEVWFTASNTGTQQHLYAVRPGSAVRTIAPMPVSVLLEDVLPDGRLLMQTGTMKVRTLVKTPSDKDERDFAWLDYGILRDMSADGTTALFDEEGEGGGPNYSVFLRKTDGSPAVRLGDGYAERISPDRQWVTSAMPGDFGRSLTLVPIGPGEPRKLPLPPPGVTSFPGWFPDGKRLAITVNGRGGQAQSHEYTIETGKTRPITPEGVSGVLVSPDGNSLLVRNSEGQRSVLSLTEGAAPRELTTLTPADTVIRWAADGRSLFISTAVARQQMTISQLSIADGTRRPIATISPSDTAGLRSLAPPVISADGRTYAYRYIQTLSDLFVGER